MAFQVMAGPDGRDVACLESAPEDCLASIDEGVDGLRGSPGPMIRVRGGVRGQETRVVTSVRDAALRFRGLGADVSGTDGSGRIPRRISGRRSTRPASAGPVSATRSRRSRPAIDRRSRRAPAPSACFVACYGSTTSCSSPTVQAVAPTAEQWDESWPAAAERYLCLTMMFNWVGWPALSVPCGLVDGLPVGLQIVGPPGSDALILRAARAFQRFDDQGGPGRYVPPGATSYA